MIGRWRDKDTKVKWKKKIIKGKIYTERWAKEAVEKEVNKKKKSKIR